MRKNVDKGNSRAKAQRDESVMGAPENRMGRKMDPSASTLPLQYPSLQRQTLVLSLLLQALTVMTGNLIRSARHRILRVKSRGL